MIFRGALDLDVDIRMLCNIDFIVYEIRVDQIPKTYCPQVPRYRVEIVLEAIGRITFESNGYDMYIRKPPEKIDGQYFCKSERGGISLDTDTPET